MNNRPKASFLSLGLRRFTQGSKRRKGLSLSIGKRQKFVTGILILSVAFFLAEYKFERAGILISVLLAVFTNLFLLWAVFEDFKENKVYEIFVLPFFYSLAFGMFFFIAPTFVLARVILTVVYALGLYSLFLSQNILVVSMVRTIALLSGARIVSFVITLVSFFLLTNTIFTFHVTIFFIIILMAIYTYFLIFHSLWTYTLQKSSQPLSIWVSALTVCLIEGATLLWFWPSSPTVIALFLTGFMYILVGLSHIWLEKRLFKGILWEYVWVALIVFSVLILFTQWGK